MTDCVTYRLGHAIGRYPWATIALAMLLCITLGGGLFFWTEEHDAVALWTTHDSRVRISSEWVNRHFSDDVRYESVIVSANDNILRPQVLVQVRCFTLFPRFTSSSLFETSPIVSYYYSRK